MPTPKRQRKREGRQLRQAQLAAARRRSKRIRQGILGGVVVVLVGVLAAVFGFSHDSTKVKAAGTSTTTTTLAPAAAQAAAAAADAKPGCPKLDGSSAKTTTWTSPPPMCIAPGATYVAHVTTDVGSFDITLASQLAPKTANNFVFLSLYHFYDGIVFHRVIPGFVVQGGDPTGTGTGGPGYKFADELPPAGAYKIGSVAMANSGPNTNGSQFFIITGQQGVQLPPSYSLFGQVTTGMDVVKKIEADGAASGTPKVEHHMVKVTISVT